MDQDPRIPGSEFTRSEWFKRGWESQELIAPKFVFFYCKHWVELGTKKNLAETVLQITKVNMATLQDPAMIHQQGPNNGVCQET